jgi:hypothetical protein
MAEGANFTADPMYTDCDEVTTVGRGVLNSRRAFRAQSQLVCAIRSAGKAYLKHRQRLGQAPGQTPWPVLQSAYGRIRIPIPEGHTARTRVARLEAGEGADTIILGVEDLTAGTLGSKFVASFSALPAQIEHLPRVAELPNQTWQALTFPADKPLAWLGSPAESIEALAVWASLAAIDSSRDFDRQCGIPFGSDGRPQDGRLHMALDLRVDRLAVWPEDPDQRLVVYHHTDLLGPDSGSHLHQLLIARAGTGEFLCRIVVHIVRIGRRDDAERPWGTMTVNAVATKPHDVSSFFSYPSLDFVA